MSWVVYLLVCSDNTIYTGCTNNLQKRIDAHNAGRGAKYTKARRPVTLLKFFPCQNKSEALRLEYKIKQMTRKQKLALQ